MDTSDEATTGPAADAVPKIIGEDGEPIGRVVRYDAGWLGCDRLPMIQRRQLQAVEVGDVVEFVVYDRRPRRTSPVRAHARPSRALDPTPGRRRTSDRRRADALREATDERTIDLRLQPRQGESRARDPQLRRRQRRRDGRSTDHHPLHDRGCLARDKGGTEGIEKEGFRPLAELYPEYIENGGEVWLCGTCTKPRAITEDMLAEGARIVGAAMITEEIVAGAKTIVYA